MCMVTVVESSYIRHWNAGVIVPVGHNAGVVSLLVVVHAAVALADEALLLAKGPDDTGAQ